MNALNYVASDRDVQIAFLVLVGFTVAAVLLARARRRQDEVTLLREEFGHKAAMEKSRLNAQLNSVDGKALPAPTPSRADFDGM